MGSLLDTAREFCRRVIEAGAVDAVIFGSVARGRTSEDSDIDVMVVVEGEECAERVYKIAGEYLREGIVIGLIIVTRDELLSIAELKTPLIENIAKEGIFHGEFIRRTIEATFA